MNSLRAIPPSPFGDPEFVTSAANHIATYVSTATGNPHTAADDFSLLAGSTPGLSV
jgi:hypothetical protein